MLDIEKDILNQSAAVSVDRDEVRSWLEIERKQMNRASAIKFAGFAILFVCLLALIGRLIESESQKIEQLAGAHPSSHAVMLNEITNELCGQDPAEYWVDQISLIGSRDTMAGF